MLFYSCDTIGLPDWGNNDTAKTDKKYARDLSLKVEDFNQQNIDKYNGFVYSVSVEKTQICFTACEYSIHDSEIKNFLFLLGIPDAAYTLKEITMKNFLSHAETAEKRGFAEETNDIYEAIGIDEYEYYFRRHTDIVEKIVTDSQPKAKLIKRANDILCGETLIPEIKRIYAGCLTPVKGHPVHYMIQSDNRRVTTEIVEILMSALTANNRLISKRYINFKFESNDNVDEKYRNVCKSMFGGAIVVKCDIGDSSDREFAVRGSDILIDVADITRKYRNNLLTILCLPRGCEKMSDLFLENAGAVSFVAIHEQAVYGETAKAYLKNLSAKTGVKPNRGLYSAIEADRGYLANDLELIFEKWFDRYLKTHIYKQYQDLETAETKYAKAKPRGGAFEELDKMIGLTSAKQVISQALDFYKAQKLFKEMGIDHDRPAMHMVFTGNPGTAKTTVARHFARIMKENDLLSVGDLREVGRADLVDRYVGGTAPRVKDNLKKARGSVLFIDEAYSLVDDRDGLFGDEAINTIVQEMENKRDDMVVIFAGYPEKMEDFLSKNPGLRSRIAFHVAFDDYNTDELCDILEWMVKKHKMSLDSGVLEKVRPVFESALENRDFGNGRFVRNMFEKAKLKQASRLVRMNVESVTKRDLETLISDDFDPPRELLKTEKKQIGFKLDQTR